MNSMYSPVALVVDDDPNAAQRVHRSFLSETGLGVLEANDLQTAYNFIHNPAIKIDVVFTDIGFARETKYQERDLHDGLDLLEEVSKTRPDLESYVYSVNADDAMLHGRARSRSLRIADWFLKFDTVGHPGLLPWARVERACLVKTLKRDKDYRERAKSVGIDVRELASDEAIAEKVRKAIVLPRLTYLNKFPDDIEEAQGYTIKEPIEVLCIMEAEQSYRASCPQIGLVTEAEGKTVEEAIDNLSELILHEVELLSDNKNKVIGYAAHVKEMLERFVQHTR